MAVHALADGAEDKAMPTPSKPQPSQHAPSAPDREFARLYARMCNKKN